MGSAWQVMGGTTVWKVPFALTASVKLAEHKELLSKKKPVFPWRGVQYLLNAERICHSYQRLFVLFGWDYQRLLGFCVLRGAFMLWQLADYRPTKLQTLCAEMLNNTLTTVYNSYKNSNSFSLFSQIFVRSAVLRDKNFWFVLFFKRSFQVATFFDA